MTKDESLPPDEGRPTIPEVMPLVQAYYAKPGNFTGGSLHVVLDDGNVSDSNVEFCISHARARADEDGVRLGEMLLRMSKTQRSKIALSSDKRRPA